MFHSKRPLRIPFFFFFFFPSLKYICAYESEKGESPTTATINFVWPHCLSVLSETRHQLKINDFVVLRTTACYYVHLAQTCIALSVRCCFRPDSTVVEAARVERSETRDCVRTSWSLALLPASCLCVDLSSSQAELIDQSHTHIIHTIKEKILNEYVLHHFDTFRDGRRGSYVS